VKGGFGRPFSFRHAADTSSDRDISTPTFLSVDHTTLPAHAHLNLLGWVSLFLFGIDYRLHPSLEGAEARACGSGRGSSAPSFSRLVSLRSTLDTLSAIPSGGRVDRRPARHAAVRLAGFSWGAYEGEYSTGGLAGEIVHGLLLREWAASAAPFCFMPILIKCPMDFRAQVRLREIANG
jgi:hypothetical protein